MDNGLMEKHAEEMDSMDLLFNWRYIPLDYPHPIDYWPNKLRIETVSTATKRYKNMTQDKFIALTHKGEGTQIEYKTYYTVDFKTDELIEKAVVQLDTHLKVSDIQLRMVTGTLDRIGSKQQLQEGSAMKVSDSHTVSVNEQIGDEVKYDLVGKMVEKTGLTRKAVVAILKKIRMTTFHQFKTTRRSLSSRLRTSLTSARRLM